MGLSVMVILMALYENIAILIKYRASKCIFSYFLGNAFENAFCKKEWKYKPVYGINYTDTGLETVGHKAM